MDDRNEMIIVANPEKYNRAKLLGQTDASVDQTNINYIKMSRGEYRSREEVKGLKQEIQILHEIIEERNFKIAELKTQIAKAAKHGLSIQEDGGEMSIVDYDQIKEKSTATGFKKEG